MAEIRKGLAAVLEAAENPGGGDFKPFCPEIRWKADDEKIILILTDFEDLQEYNIHEWIETGKREVNGEQKSDFGFFISRKDPSIGEKYDDLEDRLGQSPRRRFLGVGVELDPIVETKGGKKKVVGLEIATGVYESKGEDGETTEVEYPRLGIISLSSSNFWGWLANFQQKHDSVNEVPFEVTRTGAGTDTSYNFVHMSGIPVDLSVLFETISGVSYLTENEEDFEEVMAEAEDLFDNEDGAIVGLPAAMTVANYLLAKRIEELSDAERYSRLVAPIQEIDNKFGGKKKNGRSGRSERTTRRSSTRTSSRDKAPKVEAPTEVEAPTKDTPKESSSDSGSGFSRLRERARKQAEEAQAEAAE